ncbi:hypothetical protein VNO80_04673 [Phaseolus coccineus]|uniref:Uncharacterized protein n=1 Tax=Phaseolus coccineus TaxID=3886 RepID=A0AAN9RRX9_PHACN
MTPCSNSYARTQFSCRQGDVSRWCYLKTWFIASESIGKNAIHHMKHNDTKMFLCICHNNDYCILTNYMESIFQRMN